MIRLYAEHLLNIKTLSIQASLSTVSNKETSVTLSADGRILTLSHEGESANITLPINLSPKNESNVTLTIPAVPSRELSFRVQLEGKEGHDYSLLNGGERGGGNVIPWTADALSTETEICCRYCGGLLVERGSIRRWKDLPSEGWAEMMEFWHCHKPHEPHEHSNGDVKKGYAAGSKLALEPGVAMVDALDFLLHPDDCTNMTSTDSCNTGDALLKCSQCKATIGHSEISTGAYSLRKLHLSVSMDDGCPESAYDNVKWFSCLLLSAMENQSVRKFFLRPSAEAESMLKLWVFTPDLTVSSSAMASPEPVRFAKVLWQEVDSPEDGSERVNAMTLSEGELKPQQGELDILLQCLQDSARLIPEGGRRFLGWNVGLLRRFTIEDVPST